MLFKPGMVHDLPAIKRPANTEAPAVAGVRDSKAGLIDAGNEKNTAILGNVGGCSGQTGEIHLLQNLQINCKHVFAVYNPRQPWRRALIAKKNTGHPIYTTLNRFLFIYVWGIYFYCN